MLSDGLIFPVGAQGLPANAEGPYPTLIRYQVSTVDRKILLRTDMQHSGNAAACQKHYTCAPHACGVLVVLGSSLIACGGLNFRCTVQIVLTTRRFLTP